MADSQYTRSRKLQLQEEILSTYGVRIPGPLLAGLTPVNLSDIKNIFFDAVQRAGANAPGQHPDPQHPRPAAPTRSQGQGSWRTPREHEADHGLNCRCVTFRERSRGQEKQGQTETETQEDRTRGVTGQSRPAHEHIVFGANTPSGQTICHCAIGTDHGPIVGLGGATHA